MKIIQEPVSDNHKSAMFFHGLVAINGDYAIKTWQDGEIELDNILYVGEDIRLHLCDDITDEDIENENGINIYVDKFFVLAKRTKYGALRTVDNDVFVYDNFDEAIKVLKGYE